MCRRGQVLLATVNEQTMVPFVSQQLNNLDLALSLAKRGNLPGAEALVGQNFERLFANGQYKEAAEAAAESPQVCPLDRQKLLLLSGSCEIAIKELLALLGLPLPNHVGLLTLSGLANQRRQLSDTFWNACRAC